MKRILFTLSVSLALGMCGTPRMLAFWSPDHQDRPMLPDFDRRLAERPAKPTVAPTALADLKARVPGVQVEVGRVLGTPCFYSAGAGFLTGTGGVGGAVETSMLQAQDEKDKYRLIKAFLNQYSSHFGYGAEILNTAIITREFVGAHNGLRTAVWQQQLDGIDVFHATLMGHVTKEGELVNLATYFVPNPAGAADAGVKNRSALQSVPTITVRQAAELAAASVGDSGLKFDQFAATEVVTGANQHQTLHAAAAAKGDIDTRLVWLPMNGTSMRLCWQIILTSGSRDEMFQILVDAETGDIMYRHCLTNYLTDATYNIYPSDSPAPWTPGPATPVTTQAAQVQRVLITTNAFNTTASPLGWINDGGNTTTGNNVDAYTDHSGMDTPDPRPQGNPARTFDFPLDLTRNPTNYANATVVQLFFLNNMYHDVLYGYGFTEATGNFQKDNFGRGGLGNDPVLSEAQDGGGTDNANMSTPPDGLSPRMQMYLFSGPQPMRDGDLEADVVLHEHTHGLSNRRVGGGLLISALQTEGMGEGWSDFYAMCLLSQPGDDVNGTYPTGGYITYQMNVGFNQNYYFGIRRYPYCTDMLKNPLTFKDIDPAQAIAHTGVPLSPIYPFDPYWADEVHYQGEVWCVTLWEVRANLIKKYGDVAGNRLVLQLVTDAMPLCPWNPNFLQSRDAILQADLVDNGGINQPEIWAGFAKRGMGGSATSPGSDTTAGVVESFDMPGVSVVSTVADDSTVGNGNHTVDNNECNEVRILLRNGNPDTASNVIATLISTNPYVTVAQPFSAYPDLLRGGASFNLVPFRFYTAPNFPCGAPIDFILSIATATEVYSNYFQMRSGALGLDGFRYNNSSPVTIPDNTPGGVDMPITVSDFPSPIGKLTVSLHISHPLDNDLSLHLIAPDGTTISLAQKQGGFGQGYGVDCADASRTVFDDAAVTPITVGGAPFVGSFRPEQPLIVLNGKSGNAVNGIWRLRVIDSKAGNLGSIQCWSLVLYPTTCTDGGGPCAGSLAMQVVPAPEPVIVGSNLTYTVTVTNGWPAPAYGVQVSNSVPAGAGIVSTSSSQGTVSNLAGNLLFDFGIITNGMTGTATVVVTLPTNMVVTPTQPSFFTNRFTLNLASGGLSGTNNFTNVISTVVLPTPQVVSAGAHLIAESGPVNQGLDPGETVTMSLGLRNIGALSAFNVTATLLAGNGVVLSAGPQTNSYGTMDSGLPPSFQPFAFTALGTPGSVITATLLLFTNGVGYTTASYNFTLDGSGTFANPATITINQVGSASPYPSTNFVSGLIGVVSKVTVTLTKFTHSYPDDVNVLLVSPNGQKVLLMANAGGNVSVTNKNLSFDSTAAGFMPDNGAITSGTFRPSIYGTAQADFSAPAPSKPYSTTLDSLRAINPNGTWLLYVMDDTAGDGGFITGGWSLAIDTVVPVATNADVAVAMSSAPEPVLAGSPVAYTITVVNNGLNAATGVILTNTLPSGVNFASAFSSLGTWTNLGNLVLVSVDFLPPGSNAIVTVLANTTVPGKPIATASVVANELDLNLLNNTASLAATVRSVSNDLALTLSVVPTNVVQGQPLTCTMTVSNRGPDTAANVTVTNLLPSGVVFQSASVATFTNQGNHVVFSLGALTNGESVTCSLTAVPGVPGILSDSANVVSTTADPVSTNNVATNCFTVIPLVPTVAPAGVALVAEGFIPANNAIDPGETVTVNLSLFNNGTGATSNLVATLQSGGGVTPAGTQARDYGVLLPSGSSVARAFTFTNSAVSGENITVVLALTNAGTNFGTVSFILPVTTMRTVSTNTVILIPLMGKASPYPSTNFVSNVTQVVSKVTVTLNHLTHSSPSDIQVLLVGPGGQKALLMAGAGLSAADATLTFDDDAVTSLPQAGVLTSGNTKPTAYIGGSLPIPAPVGPYTSALSVFGGVNPNGPWMLYVYDGVNGDLGRIDGGWSLNFITIRALSGAADVGVTTTFSPSTASVGADLTLNVTVANNGPGNATGVLVTNVLPTGFSLRSAVTEPAKGVPVQIGNTLVCNAGTLTNGEFFTLRIVGQPTLSGMLTNIASVTRSEADSNPANDVSIQTVTTPVQLVIQRLGTNVVVSWPYPSPGFILESSANLGSAANWLQVDPAQVLIVGNQNLVPMSASGSSNLFFRIRKP